MSVTMEEVVAAARAGDKKNAQLLLAQYIQANPNDAKGWYLMSQLVDSKARRAAYLSKTLALDPYHERAWAEFYSMPTEVINKLESAQGPHQAAAAKAAAIAAAPELVAEPAERAEAIMPRQDESLSNINEEAAVSLPESVRYDEPFVTASPALAGTETTTQERPQQPAAKESSKTGLTALLILLIVATIAVLTYLLYLLLLG